MSNLSDIFNLPASIPNSNAQLEVLPSITEVRSELQQDFDSAREKLIDIAEISSTFVSEMSRLSKSTQSPRMYEILSKAIMASVIANKAVIEIHKNKQDIDEPLRNTVTNNTMILTTAELQTVLADAQKRLNDQSNITK